MSDPAQLRAAAGHFSQLNFVTHITFAPDKMSYAVLRPVKPDIGLAIPPLDRKDILLALRKTFIDATYKKALHDFEKRASEDCSSEWSDLPSVSYGKLSKTSSAFVMKITHVLCA